MTETKYYVINISKKRSSDDKFGIHWAQIRLPDYDEEKAKAKMDLLKVLLGKTFIVTMVIKIKQEN